MRSDRRLSGGDGVSLVEVMVTLGLLGLVLAIFSTAMVSMFGSVHTAERRSESNDAVRLAMQELDRQMRSGNVIRDPSLEVPAGMSLRIYTQTNAPTATEENRCVQWRVLDERLQTRAWPHDNPAAATTWRTVAEHIYNEVRGRTAFEFDDDQPGFGQRIVRVSFVVNRDERAGSDSEVSASLTGRNVQFGFPLTLCETIPEDA